MDLRTFIKTALLDVINGISDAQKETPEGTVVPDTSIAQSWVEIGITKIQVIDFEVLVRAEESKGSEAKIGVVAGVFGGGVKGQSSADNSHESKIKLRIPVQLPTSGGIGETPKKTLAEMKQKANG
jgi:hypothetical protein